MKRCFQVMALTLLLATGAAVNVFGTVNTVSMNVLIADDCNFDTQNGVWVAWHSLSSGGEQGATTYTQMTGKGNGWWQASFDVNEYAYSFQIANKNNLNAEGVQKTYSPGSWQYAEEAYWEIPYNSTLDNNYKEDWYLSSATSATTNHNRTPKDMQVTGVADGKATFTWNTTAPETEELNYYLSFYDSKGNYVAGTNYQYNQKAPFSLTHDFKNATDLEIAYWTVSLATSSSYSYITFKDAKGPGFTLPANPYAPSNLRVKDNGSNSYTFKWDTKKTVPKNFISLYNSSTSSYDIDNKEITGNEYTTTLAANQSYYFYVNTYDESDTYIASTQISFNTNVTEANTADMYIQIPSDSKFLTGKGVAMVWKYEGFEENVVTLTADSKNWYHFQTSYTKDNIKAYLINSTDPATATIQTSEWQFDKWNTQTSYYILNFDESDQWTRAYTTAEVYGNNYTPKNPKADVSEGGIASLSWETTEDDPKQWEVIWIDSKGKYYSQTVYSTSAVISLGNSTDETISKWWVYAYKNYSTSSAYVYGDPFTVKPSPYAMKGLKVTSNKDNTYTVDFTAEKYAEEYNVSFRNNSTYNTYYMDNVPANGSKPSIISPYLPESGDYTVYVYAYGYVKGTYQTVAQDQGTFTADLQPLGKVNVSIFNSWSNNNPMDTEANNGLWLYYWTDKGNSTVKMTDLGGNWWTADVDITEAATFSFLAVNKDVSGGDWSGAKQTYDVSNVYQSGCWTMYNNGEEKWDIYKKSDCDDRGKNYIPTDLKAEGGAGEVTLTWAAKDTAYTYLLNINGNNYYYYPGNNDNKLAYTYKMNNKTAENVSWSIRAYNQNWDYVSAELNGPDATVQPSPYVPTNLKAVVNDDNTVTLTWATLGEVDDCRWQVELYDPKSGSRSFNVQISEATFPLLYNGDYTWTVYSYDRNSNFRGEESSNFTATLKPVGNVTVNVLVPTDCNMPVSEGISIWWWSESNPSGSCVKATDKGGRWYEATFNVTDPCYNLLVVNREITKTEDWTGAVQTSDLNNENAQNICLEVKWAEDGSVHGWTYGNSICSRTDHNYVPKNLKVTPGEGKAVFEWEAEDYAYYYSIDIYEKDKSYAAYSYRAYNLTGPAKREIIFTNAVTTEYTWTVTPYSDYSTQAGMTVAASGTFTMQPTPFIPEDLKVVDNKDNTYSIFWKYKEGVQRYEVEYSGPDYGYMSWEYDGSSLSPSVRTDKLKNEGDYYVSVRAYNENGSLLGEATTNFTATLTALGDVTIRVLVTDDSNMPTEKGMWIWWWSNSQPGKAEKMKADGGNWYSTTLSLGTDFSYNILAVNKDVENEGWSGAKQTWNAEGLTSDCCMAVGYANDGSYHNISSVSCEAKNHDYTPTGLKATGGKGMVTFTWASKDAAKAYQVIAYDEKGNNIASHNVEGNTLTVYTMNTEAVSVKEWSVFAFDEDYNQASKAVKGTGFSIQPSEYNPTGLKATDNGDGTWTLSWNAVDGVARYEMRVYDPNGNYAFSRTLLAGEKLQVKANQGINLAGKYTWNVQVYNESYELIGHTASEFTVAENKRDIKVRLLLNEDCGIEGKDFSIGLYNEKTYTTKWSKPTEESNHWYSYTFTTSNPSAQLNIGTTNNYGQVRVSGDTCLQITYGSSIHPAACNATSHNYTPTDLKATAYAGGIDFSWSAKDKSDTYIVYCRDEKDNYISGWYAYDTKFSTSLDDEWAGKTIKWYVYAYDSEYGNRFSPTVEGPAVTYIQSTVKLTELKSSSEDEVTFNFTWESNTADLYYDLEIFEVWSGSNYYYKHDTVSTTSATFTFPQSGKYSWSVRALDKQYKSLTTKVTGDTLTVKEGIDISVKNLKATVSGNNISLTWETPAEYSQVYIYYQEDNYTGEVVADEIVKGNTFTLNNQREGVYECYVTALTEFSKGRYNTVGEYQGTYATITSEKTYKLTVTVDEGGALYPDPSGNYPEGYKIYISTGSADGEHEFVSWSDGVTDAWREIVMTKDITLHATYKSIKQYTLTISAGEGGTVNTEVNGKYTEGDNVNIKAVPNSGYLFKQWSDGNTEPNRNVSITGDITLKAEFVKVYQLTLSANAGGSVNTEVNGMHRADEDINIIATPDAGYRFTGWSDGSKLLSRVINLTADLTLTATFELAGSTPQHTLTIAAGVGGSVNSQLNGTYYEGDEIEIIATANEGYEFDQWSDGNKDAKRTITIGTADLNLTASFKAVQYQLTITAGTGGTVNTEVNGKYSAGQTVTIVATPNDDYEFDKWSDGNTNASRTITIGKEDLTLTATFKKKASGIDDADEVLMQVRVQDGEVIVSLNRADDIRLFDLTGRLCGSAVQTGEARFTVPAAGIYIVRTSGDVRKVNVQ